METDKEMEREIREYENFILREIRKEAKKRGLTLKQWLDAVIKEIPLQEGK